MREHADLIVVMPIGPGTPVDFITDTINSFIFYTRVTHRFILADDSQQGIGKEIETRFPSVRVITTKKPMGGMAGLYINLAMAFAEALKHYDFKAILKLDTDALVIGNPESEAIDLFDTSPTAGIAGQYPRAYDGKPWDLAWPRDRIVNGTMTWKFVRRPVANILLRKFYIKALNKGYHTGESVFGGAYFMNRALVEALHENRLLPSLTLGRLNLGEDHLFSLLAKALGFDLCDLSSSGLPFACAWKGLPASPEQLFAQQKKIIHSTRGWNSMDESAIRKWFREKREAQGAPAVIKQMNQLT